MIEYISGPIAELSPTNAIIDVAGIGYDINISLTTYSALEGTASAKLLVHEIIREDAHLLYGFADSRERDLFRLLIGVSGVGANTARMLLSSLKPDELESAIAGGAVKSLKSVKGIGAKTAERIIVDLKDKIKPGDATLLVQPATLTSDVYDEALAALTMLGFARQASQKALKKIFEADPAVKVETAIKRALTMM